MLSSELQQELFKTVGVAVVALMYTSAGESFSTGGTVVIALSVVQAISLANVLFTLPPKKVIKADTDEKAPGSVFDGLAVRVRAFLQAYMQCLALFLLPFCAVKAMFLSDFIGSGLPVALVASFAGAVHSLLHTRTDHDILQTSPYEAEFWGSAADMAEQKAEAILADVSQAMDVKPELEKQMETFARQAWEEHYTSQERMAYLEGDDDQWNHMFIFDDA